MTDAGDVLLTARNYLATGKWCKGTTTDRDGNRCALGALNDAHTRNSGLMRTDPNWFSSLNAYWDAGSALEQHIDPKYARWGMRLIAAFNDHPDTTLADVLLLFDKALADLGRLGDVQ